MKNNIDYKLFFTVLFLIIFGMIMISSVSVYSSFRVTNNMANAGYITEAYNHFYVLRNIIHVIISMILLGIIVKVKYTFFEKYSKQIFGFAILLLLIVLMSGIVLQGARGWISIPGIPFTIQPTEFLKLSLIIFFAAFFKKYKGCLGDFNKGYIPFMGFLSLIVILVGSQPDFGTIMVIVPISVIMYFYAGMNIKHLLVTIGLGIFLMFSIYSIGDYNKKTGINSNKLGYITQRIDSFLQSSENIFKGANLKNDRLDQTRQALIAIGSGGFSGLGFGGSIQKFGYLPEVQGDFIFSVIIEELGFIGGLVLMWFYLYIGYRGFYIASRVSDLFAKYTAVGISSRILIQAFINIGVNLNIMPLTGITLPFISYGGSSLLSLILGLAILLNISRYIDDKKQFARLNRKKFMF